MYMNFAQKYKGGVLKEQEKIAAVFVDRRIWVVNLSALGRERLVKS